MPRRPRPEDWPGIIDEFKAGATDGQLAYKWNITPAAVVKQRQKFGVFRADYPRAPYGPLPPPDPSAPPEPAPVPARPAPAVILPPDADALTAADALLRHGGALAEGGHMRAAAEAIRLSRLQFQSLAARRQALGASAAFEPAFDADAPLEPPPVLREAQRPPEGDWRSWLFLGGRGAGKTLAGAAWLAARARTCARLALVAPTLLDAREVMIDGPSGVRGLAAGFGPDGGRPAYEPSRRRLVWPNGAVGRVFSAEDPDSLRGPQFEAAWADELCAWPRPEATLAMLRMGLRLRPGGVGCRVSGVGEGGEDAGSHPTPHARHPQLVLTTTPKPTAALRALLAEPGLVVTRGSALDNAEHLSPGFVADLRALYGGTRLERQEIDGEVLDAPEGGVFRHADIARARELGAGDSGASARPGRFERLVVAVDPPAGLAGAACGIVTVGRTSSAPSPGVGRDSPRSGQGGEGRSGAPSAWVLEDRTVWGLTPGGWAARVAEAASAAALLGPVQVIAEANQGGEMVRQVLAGAGLNRPVRLVHAVLGKRARAEPVALLYEQGRVAHAPGLEALEDQMLLLGADAEAGARGESPDRADALVWALTELMLAAGEGPRVRAL